jgi:hypothetical protein
VVSKRRSTMRGGDCSDGKDIKISFCEVSGKVPTVETTLCKDINKGDSSVEREDKPCCDLI